MQTYSRQSQRNIDSFQRTSLLRTRCFQNMVKEQATCKGSVGLLAWIRECRGEGTRQTITKHKAGLRCISLTQARLEDTVIELCWRKSQNRVELDQPHSCYSICSSLLIVSNALNSCSCPSLLFKTALPAHQGAGTLAGLPSVPYAYQVFPPHGFEQSVSSTWNTFFFFFSHF